MLIVQDELTKLNGVMRKLHTITQQKETITLHFN